MVYLRIQLKEASKSQDNCRRHFWMPPCSENLKKHGYVYISHEHFRPTRNSHRAEELVFFDVCFECVKCEVREEV